MEPGRGEDGSSFVEQLLAAQASTAQTSAGKTRKVYTRLGQFDSIDAAKLFINGLPDGIYRHSYNSNSTHRVSTFLECSSHVDCESVLRIVRMRSDDSCVVDQRGTHASVNTDKSRTGINRSIKPIVDDLLNGCGGPMYCLTTLHVRYKDNPKMYNVIPTIEQLQHRAQTLQKNPDKNAMGVKTYNDMLAWASGRMCNSQETFF